MDFALSDLLKAVGPTASIIFAAWIFMGFLQQRYDAAVDRYREMIGQYREAEQSEARRENAQAQIMCYKRRCELMNCSCFVGLLSAVMLLLTLITAEIDVIFPRIALVKYISAGTTLAGFILVIAAAVLVMIESLLVHRQMKNELRDISDLAKITGQEPGSVRR